MHTPALLSNRLFWITSLSLLLADSPLVGQGLHIQQVHQAQDLYDQCYLQRREQFEDVCEPVGDLATAIVNGCPEELNQFRHALASTPYLSIEAIDEIIEHLKETRREQAITRLIERRAVAPCK